jgi:hypothetical protein
MVSLKGKSRRVFQYARLQETSVPRTRAKSNLIKIASDTRFIDRILKHRERAKCEMKTLDLVTRVAGSSISYHDAFPSLHKIRRTA